MEYSYESEEALIRTLGIPVEVKNAHIDGHDIHFVVAGDGSPVLLLHGGTFGWGMWYKIFPELAREHTVYALDLPGSGLSSSLDYSKVDFETTFVDVVEEFIKKNIAHKNLTIVGHSFSGWIAMRLIMRSPDITRRLVLIDTTGLSDRATVPDLLLSCSSFARFLATVPFSPKRENKKLITFLSSAFAKKHVILSTEFIDYFYSTMQRSHNLVFISALIRDRKKLHIADVAALPLPKTLVIWGREDRIVSAKMNTMCFADLANAQVEIIPDTGHVPPLESPVQTINCILQYINK